MDLLLLKRVSLCLCSDWRDCVIYEIELGVWKLALLGLASTSCSIKLGSRPSLNFF